MSLIFEALKRSPGSGAGDDAGASPLPGAAPATRAARAWLAVVGGAVAGGAIVGALIWSYRSGESAGRQQADAQQLAGAEATTAAAPGAAPPLRRSAPPASGPARNRAAPAIALTVPSAPANRVPAAFSIATVPPVPQAAAPTSAAARAAAPASAPAPAPAAAIALAGAPVQTAPAAANKAAQPAPPETPRPLAPKSTLQVASTDAPYDAQAGFQAFLHQVQAQQWTEARQSRDAMIAALGPEHVLSLRVQGYLALRQNELDKARSSYQRLLDRLPDDREGGLNLALIDWRSGDKDAARKRLATLADKYPNDGEIKALALNIRLSEGSW